MTNPKGGMRYRLFHCGARYRDRTCDLFDVNETLYH